MSFVLQLGSVNRAEEVENNNPLLVATEINSPLAIETSLPKSVIAGAKTQNVQNLKAVNSSAVSISPNTSLAVKPITVTYPMNKNSKDMQKVITSQTNTTQMMTTRVISQKAPSNYQVHPVPVNVASQVMKQPSASVGSSLSNSPKQAQAPIFSQNLAQPVKVQVGSEVSINKQSPPINNPQCGGQMKLQQITVQPVSNTPVQTMVNNAIPTVQRVQGKAPNQNINPQQNLTQPSVNQQQQINQQNANQQQALNKPKIISNVSQHPPIQRNAISRMQTMTKSQVHQAQNVQITMNQVMNNANMQRVQSSTNIQKVQAPNAQKVQQSFNNQKSIPQGMNNLSHPNHKMQQQINQQTHQVLQKMQNAPAKSAVQKQPQTVMNNAQKSVPAMGMQKQQPGQQLTQQVVQQSQKSQAQSQQQRPTVVGNVHKSQTLVSVNSNRNQNVSTVSKSNTLPNLMKVQNSNVITTNKQGVITQSQTHPQPTSQLQQQLLHPNLHQQMQQLQMQNQQSQQLHMQQQQQIPQQQLYQVQPQLQNSQMNQQMMLQKQQINTLVQKSQSLQNIHQKGATITPIPNNQKTSANLNAKAQQQQQQQHQQQMVLRMATPKNQTPNMQGNMKPAGKATNAVKASNQQNNMQPFPRNANCQPVKVVQQSQNVIFPQNAQKQPGCIKTIPPQKPAVKNNSSKGVVKTTMNTNVNPLKAQNPVASVGQKSSIKTLMPQQTGGPSMLIQKTQPSKIQQANVQQKPLSLASPFPQQAKQQTGQVKTLLPVNTSEPRRDMEIKKEVIGEVKEEDAQNRSLSPSRRMPLPYEVCLQFVLQDHNYGAPPPRTPPPQSPPPHPKQQPVNGASSSVVVTQNSFIYGPVVPTTTVEDDAASAISSEAGREAEPEGEETETAPEGEGDDEDSITRCICDFEHDDGYMICCDRCLVWQHVDCMGIDRSNIPDEYLCEICRPRRVDRQRARALQMRKREELLNSDTTSDSSSTTSVDTDVGTNANPKKRSLPQHVPRRKSDPPQVRRLNNNNNNTVKRQRRETHPRQPSAVRNKKETAAKRVPGKRKTKRRISVEDKEEEAQDSWGSNMAPLRQWIERYEEAVTNHYSPELRARISSIKINGTHNDLRQSNVNIAATGKCRLNVHSNNLRFLVATMYLPPNTPVVELRGKYMLSTQHRPSHPQGRQHAQRPGPFVFFYRLPRDGTEVCVDTRTYGNDARFVRRSCKPNAEVKHCIEKGTLHLYIVSTTAIEKNAEITIRHEQHDLLLSPNSNSQLMSIICACNNPKECQINVVPPVTKKSTNGAVTENSESGREKRRRGRRNTVSEESEPVSTVSNTTVTQPAPVPPPPPAAPVVPPVAIPAPSPPVQTTVTPAPPKRSASTGSSIGATTRQAAKEESMQSQTTLSNTSLGSTSSLPTPEKEKKDKKKLTREERKMEAIMKAFERMEKAQARKQEVLARNAQRKESGGTHSDNDDIHGPIPQQKQGKSIIEKPLRRKRRKGRARTTSSSNSNNRRSRLNSADSDLSSGDESTSIQSPPLSNQSCLNRDTPYLSRIHTPTKEGNEPSGNGNQGISTAAGLLLALANSNVPGPSSPPLNQPTPVKSPTCDSGASSSSQSSTPSTPLSSACLLVAAAVGPLAPGFKFPKTKKVLMNEWLKESPDPIPAHIPQISPSLTNLSSAPLSNPIIAMEKSPDFLSPTDSPSEYLTQSYAAKGLATLVQAVNSVSGICESPPQRRQSINQQSSCPVSSGSAKKRWLRQAISEECDSPNSRPESPPSEMVAPPKKRRIARESLSSDNYTPPTTPTSLVPEALHVGRPSCNDDEFVDRMNSPTESRISQDYDSEPLKDYVTSQQNSSYETDCKLKIDQDMSPILSMKNESNLDTKIKLELMSSKGEISMKTDISLQSLENFVKPEKLEEEVNCKSESQPMDVSFCKNESFEMKCEEIAGLEKDEIIQNERNIQDKVNKSHIDIVSQNDEDIEMDELSSSVTMTESETMLKQRVADMKLEFNSGVIQKTEDTKCEIEKMDDKSDGDSDFDEFDVEAQMKKITGDDGDDYKEKVDICSEKDKSMDGLEGLMDSSKEDSDSDSDDREMDDVKSFETPISTNKESIEERAFKEFEMKCNTSEFIKDEIKEEVEEKVKSPVKELEKIELPSEELKLEPKPSNVEEVEPPKQFPSMLPLSERIRKKPDPTPMPKSHLDIEAAIIESSIEMEANLINDVDKKSILSTALRELLEAKIEDETVEPAETVNVEPEREPSPPLEINQEKPEENLEEKVEEKLEVKLEAKEEIEQVTETSVKNTEDTPADITPVKVASPANDVIRLKDPRTCAPKDLTSKMETPVKRKVRMLSISEYRKRKQQSTGTPPEADSSNDPSSDKAAARGRSDSASSGTSSLSSDEESSKVPLDLPGLSTLPLFTAPDGDEKKGTEEGKIGWSAAPTLVERQRENLTERLKREFGLFLSDDEEERARKQGLNAEAILKARKEQPPPPPPTLPYPAVAGNPTTYPLQQLPPQPYIPPPGSASIHYSQFQAKASTIPYQNFATPQTIGPTVVVHPVETNQLTTTQPPPPQQFLIPQAPPGSNPYPPQYVPQMITTVSTPNYPLGTPTPVPVPAPVPMPVSMAVPIPVPMPVPPIFNTPPPTQKSFFNQPAPRS